MSRSGPRALALFLSVALTACAEPPSAVVAPTSAPPAEVSATPTISPTASPRPTASNTPVTIPEGVAQLEGALRSLATWRPDREALILEQPGPIFGRLLLALPLDGSAPVPLVGFEQGESTGWDVRPNGSLAISILLDDGRSARIAVWDSATGRANWATPAESGVLHQFPVWSADGASLYYSAIRPPDSLGLFRVAANGGRPTRILAPEGSGGNPERLTTDGGGLVWSRVQSGGSVDVLDLRTGRNTTFDASASAIAPSWRGTQPRALVIKDICCSGPPAGTLYVWDDRQGVGRAIFGRELAADDSVSAAVWDPSGERLVAAVWDFAISGEISQALVLMNEDGQERVRLPETEDAIDLHWARAGIVFMRPGGGRSGGHGIGTEVLIVDPAGGTPRQLYRGEPILRARLISP